MRRVLLPACFCVVAIAACAREPAPPADPSASPQEPRVNAAMRALAGEVAALDVALAEPSTEVTRAQADRSLARLARQVADLQARPEAARHPLIAERGLEPLLGDIELARAALKLTPPDDRPARAVSAGCRACHRVT